MNQINYFSQKLELVEELAVIDLKENSRVRIRLVKRRTKIFFLIVREYRRKDWPKDMWKFQSGTPLLNKDVFKSIIKLVNLRGLEISHKLDWEENETSNS